MKKIILLCSAGMSTSILVRKMQLAAKEQDFECEIAASPTSQAQEKARDADVILLGPQVRFQKNTIEELCPGVPVDIIDMRLYGLMNGAAVLKFAQEAMKG